MDFATRTAPYPGSHPAAERSARFARTLDELHDLRSEWDSISASWPSPMKSHDWARTCVHLFGADHELTIVVAGKGPGLAIAPLVRTRRDGTRLEFIGAHELPEPMDFLYSDGSDPTELATALVRLRLPMRFLRVPVESPLLPALQVAYRWRGIVVSRPSRGSPWIPLDPSWSDPEKHLNRARRSNLRRSRRIAEELGAVTVEILSPAASELGRLLDEAYAVEAGGWKGREGSALLHNAREGEFYRRYAAAACARGVLRICFLRIGGRAAAMQLAVETGNRFWLLKIGYADEFARCSPGTLLLTETIRYAARSGLRAFEFLGDDESWTRSWTSHFHPCVSFWSYPAGIRGGVALARDAAAALRNRLGARAWRAD
ncbi:MAG TPA: GNAT family N-acetyltransferase [Thermoplasmata archaeon]|nr:GNAT family N-acetyltransferase [Thermoplasmata archaeon]